MVFQLKLFRDSLVQYECYKSAISELFKVHPISNMIDFTSYCVKSFMYLTVNRY